MFDDHIFAHDADPWFLPREPASVPGYVKHVHCDGSRDHVQSWLGYEDWLGRTYCVTRCSVPDCIVNHEAEQTIAEHEMPRQRSKRAAPKPKGSARKGESAVGDSRDAP